MTRWKSQEKKQSVIETKIKYPHLTMRIIAERHGIAPTTASQWWNDFRKSQRKENDQTNIS